MKKRTFSTYITIMLGIAILTAICAGCATVIPFQVQRPPTWNTLGIKRLAIMPFTTSNNSREQADTANWLTNEVRSNIQATNHFTLVDHGAVQRERANGNIESADAFWSGQVTSVSVSDSQKPGSYKDRNGNVIDYIDYRRDVSISFNYSLTSARGLEVIGSDNKTLTTYSTSRNDRSGLSSAESMVQGIIQRNMRTVGQYVAPYTITERRKFEKETSKDKIVKERAKAAEAQVKAGSYKLAQESFLGIYQDYNSIAAAYNAALLIEVLGDMEGAVAFLQTVHTATGNPKIASEIARLRKAMDDAGLLEAYAENQHQRDKVIALMIDTLPSKLPSDREPKVALINNSQNHAELAEMITNALLEGFLSKNITVVDRSSQALMNMEKNYQLSGNVSDEDMVRIGNETGVNTFILVSVTGSGATRRLSVRMLDVERSTILYQSPQSDEMNL